MFGFESPEAKKMAARSGVISVFVVMVFAALMISAFVFNIISTDKALAGGSALMVLNTVQLGPTSLKARQIDYDYKAKLIDEKYAEERGKD